MGAHEWLERINGSNIAAAAVDSLVFVGLIAWMDVAFGTGPGFPVAVAFGLFTAKVAGGVVWSLLLWRLWRRESVRPEQPATVGEKPEWCDHPRYVLRRESRTVECRKCGRQIDAFDVLVGYAADWDRIVRWRQEAERRRRLARDRLDEILRLERNARGRVRRADPSLERPTLPYGHGQGSRGIT